MKPVKYLEFWAIFNMISYSPKKTDLFPLQYKYPAVFKHYFRGNNEWV